MLAKMRNMGEACTAANRSLVYASVAAEFGSRLAARMCALRVGRGTDDGVQVGPLVDATSREKVASLVASAVDGGAQVMTGGSAVGDRGWFDAPTVLTDVPADAELIAEEIFGPVAPVTTFTTTDEAVEQANDTEYGLVAYGFTRDLATALAQSEQLDTGMVGINQGVVSNPATPFGGVKHSGFGREGWHRGHRGVPRTRYVGIRP